MRLPVLTPLLSALSAVRLAVMCHRLFPQSRILLMCDDTVQGAVPVLARQNMTSQCGYTLVFRTAAACASVSLSPGWICVVVGITILSIYVFGGMAVNLFVHKTLQGPHEAFWMRRRMLATKGFWFLLVGCNVKRLPASVQLMPPATAD